MGCTASPLSCWCRRQALRKRAERPGSPAAPTGRAGAGPHCRRGGRGGAWPAGRLPGARKPGNPAARVLRTCRSVAAASHGPFSHAGKWPPRPRPCPAQVCCSRPAPRLHSCLARCRSSRAQAAPGAIAPSRPSPPSPLLVRRGF